MRESERERGRGGKQTDRELEDHSGSAGLQNSRGGKWRGQQSRDVGHGACLPRINFKELLLQNLVEDLCLPMMMFTTAEPSRKLCARGRRIVEDMCLP